MLDIHAHIHFPEFDADRDEAVRRARGAGVGRMICVGTSPEDNPQAIAVAERYENVYASVGVHPHTFDESGILNLESWKDDLRKLAKHPKVVAIGECGLDYFSRNPEQPITDGQKALQKEGFLAQIEIAQELGLPLIIHTRPSAGTMDAYEDVLDLLKAKSCKLKAILHCYQGDTEITKKFLGLPDVYFSFAGNITYPVKKSAAGTKDDLTETVKSVPVGRLFIETDCPFLAPQGKRGERNEPAYVRMTADKVCELKGIAFAEFDKEVDGNFKRVFGAEEA